MTWWNEFADAMEFDIPLPSMTWFRLGGRARFLFRPRSAEQLSLAWRRAKEQGLAVRVLGSGANVLVRDDGFDGVVIRLDQPAFRAQVWCHDTVELGAGVDLMPFARACSFDGRTGLEGLAGIPATIGGGVKMNCGGRYGELGDVVVGATLFNADGGIERWDSNRLQFGYRRSAVEDRIILSATLRLPRHDPVMTMRTYQERLAEKFQSQPIAAHSAGCIFRNPDGQSAGALIDRAGLKGTRSGLAVVSNHHANFIVAQRGATSTDVLRLIEVVQRRVEREFGTKLETEIDIW